MSDHAPQFWFRLNDWNSCWSVGCCSMAATHYLILSFMERFGGVHCKYNHSAGVLCFWTTPHKLCVRQETCNIIPTPDPNPEANFWSSNLDQPNPSTCLSEPTGSPVDSCFPSTGFSVLIQPIRKGGRAFMSLTSLQLCLFVFWINRHKWEVLRQILYTVYIQNL